MQINFDASDFQLKIVVAGEQKDFIDLSDAAKINEKNLPKEYVEQPSHFAWYSALLVVQEEKCDRAKYEIEKYRSELSLKFRKEGTTSGVKLTENSIESMIVTDKKFALMQDELITLETLAKKLKILVNASIQRKDMLIQLGLLEREERRQFGMGNGMKT